MLCTLVGYMEFSAIYLSQSKVFYEITKQQSGAISTITTDVQTKQYFRLHLGPTQLGALPIFERVFVKGPINFPLGFDCNLESISHKVGKMGNRPLGLEAMQNIHDGLSYWWKSL